MKVRDAMLLAEKIRDVLIPFCEPERCAIAGSIRRARPEVNDVDLVVQPRGLEAAAALRAVLRKCPVVKEGPHYMVVRSKCGFPIDVWFAHGGTSDLLTSEPGNWGSLLLCRTGSKEHNIVLAQKARTMEMKWETSRGLVLNPDTARAKVIASATEEEIFQCLGMEFVPPAFREAQGLVPRRAEGGEEEKTDWGETFA